MSRHLLRFVPVFILASVLAGDGPVYAQTTTTFTDTVEVELVLVDVLVEDSGGEPVLGLTRDDFRLFEDGNPVEISQFTSATRSVGATDSKSTAAGPARGTGSESTGDMLAASSQLVVFIDYVHTKPSTRHVVLAQLEDALKSGLQPNDEVMLVSYAGSLDIVLPMTRDRSALRKALRQEGEHRAIGVLVAQNEKNILQLIEQEHLDQTTLSRRGDACTTFQWLARAHSEQVYARVVRTIDGLERFVDSLAGFQGRKSLLHVSDGIPLVAGQEAWEYASSLCDGTARARGVEGAVDTSMFGTGKYTRWDPTKTWAELRQFDTSKEWTRLAARANTYQVSFYTLQAGGLQTNRSAETDAALYTSPEMQISARQDKQAPLFLLANETGGRASLEATDIEASVQQMLDDSQLRYQLAYSAPTPADGKQHRIEVEVDRPGVEIHHRKIYRSKTPDERIADDLTAILLYGREQNPLEARLEIGDRTGDESGIIRVQVQLQIPLDKLVLLPDGESGKALFSVFIAARNDHGFITPVGHRTIPVVVPEARQNERYTYIVEVPLRGKRSDIAVALHDDVGGETSYLRRSVKLDADL